MFGAWITVPSRFSCDFSSSTITFVGTWASACHTDRVRQPKWAWNKMCYENVNPSLCTAYIFITPHQLHSPSIYFPLLSITHSDWSLTCLCLEDETHQAETVWQNKVWFSVLICVPQVQYPARRMRLVWWKLCLLVTTRWFVLLTTSARR